MKEIERKFLVDPQLWKLVVSQIHDSQDIVQGYLSDSQITTVRVRVGPTWAVLTVKGPTTGISRDEFEYSIPREDGVAMLDLCEIAPLQKTRHWIQVKGHLWTVDEFRGLNNGLLLAEVELTSPDEQIIIPDWMTREVSHDPRFYNSYLVSHKV